MKNLIEARIDKELIDLKRVWDSDPSSTGSQIIRLCFASLSLGISVLYPPARQSFNKVKSKAGL